MEPQEEKWVLLSKWLGKGMLKDHMRSTPLWVRVKHVLYFRQTKRNIYAHVAPSVFGTSKGSLDYGILHPDSEEMIKNLHKNEQEAQNDLVRAIDGLQQQLEYNPIIGTAMLDARRRVEEAFQRDAKRLKHANDDDEKK